MFQGRVRALLIGAAIVVATTGLAACGGSTSATGTRPKVEVNPAGDIPDDQVFIPYQAPDGRFSVSVPEGWARTDLADGASFTDKYNTVRIEQTPEPDPVTVDSTKSVDVPELQHADPTFRLGDVTAVTPAGAPAVRTTYTADATPDAVTGKSVRLAVERYQFWKDGTLVTVTLSGAKGADNVDPWRIVADSFRWSA